MFLSLKVGGRQKEGCNKSGDIEINIAVIGLVFIHFDNCQLASTTTMNFQNFDSYNNQNGKFFFLI
jgi:hypothetical protein